MREVAILSAVRTAIGRAPRGVFKNTRPDDLAANVASLGYDIKTLIAAGKLAIRWASELTKSASVLEGNARLIQP